MENTRLDVNTLLAATAPDAKKAKLAAPAPSTTSVFDFDGEPEPSSTGQQLSRRRRHGSRELQRTTSRRRASTRGTSEALPSASSTPTRRRRGTAVAPESSTMAASVSWATSATPEPKKVDATPLNLPSSSRWRPHPDPELSSVSPATSMSSTAVTSLDLPSPLTSPRSRRAARPRNPTTPGRKSTASPRTLDLLSPVASAAISGRPASSTPRRHARAARQDAAAANPASARKAQRGLPLGRKNPSAMLEVIRRQKDMIAAVKDFEFATS
ncbi:uncharacterized protein MONBRDRAFT_11398 [Monosiga brevicollis MX1]|uniref:Uncharacterized protein n=1 Tax=Monosiga brevicollis TaxID=81824 RepID=A9V952_MONBE|nr:uncharacterized protein MONBRDRAFT_11398 [Monosiga brevicollis MX1]EDQ86067.1 predicted protein [Monosiga brevicollis MX1]|eukprot:XP_001749261.1 hypothetical protein [Monosiga brevicollis MX1]